MNGAEIAGWVSAIAAVTVAAAAALEIRWLRRDLRRARTAEINSVALETEVVIRPNRADAGDGMSRWQYEFSVHNPGRLPITNVEALIRFPIPVSREHHDRSLDAPTATLDKIIPVIAAGSVHKWKRTVLLEHERRSTLRQTRATVSFSTADRGRRTTVWPPESATT